MRACYSLVTSVLDDRLPGFSRGTERPDRRHYLFLLDCGITISAISLEILEQLLIY